MNRIALIITSAIFGAILAGALLSVARMHAPFARSEVDVVGAIASAIEEELDNTPSGSTLYIRTDLFEVELLKLLSNRFPSLKLLPWSERPADHGCEGLVLAPCMRPDYITTSVISFPLWNTALVSVGFFNGGSEIILVKVFGGWRMISNQTWEI